MTQGGTRLGQAGYRWVPSRGVARAKRLGILRNSRDFVLVVAMASAREVVSSAFCTIQNPGCAFLNAPAAWAAASTPPGVPPVETEGIPRTFEL